jgi:hypothetical protein
VCTEVEFISLLDKKKFRDSAFLKHPLTQTQRVLSPDAETSKRTGYTKSDITLDTIDTSCLGPGAGSRAIGWWEVKIKDTELLKLFLQVAWKLVLGNSLTGGRFAGMAHGLFFRRVAIDDEGRMGIDMADSETMFNSDSARSGVSLEQFIAKNGYHKRQYTYN